MIFDIILNKFGYYKREQESPKKHRTIVRCNNKKCMDNEKGECILSFIDINIEDGIPVCKDYSCEDPDIVKAFMEEAKIVTVRKVSDETTKGDL